MDDIDQQIEERYRSEDLGLSVTWRDVGETCAVVAVILACMVALAWSLMGE